MAHFITDSCIGCGACFAVCPLNLITEDENGYPVIDADACINCGACADLCPINCIVEL